MPGKYIHIGDILTCCCNTPLAKRTGPKTFEVMRFYKGDKVLVEVSHGAGISTIGCADCGYKYTCIGIYDMVIAS